VFNQRPGEPADDVGPVGDHRGRDVGRGLWQATDHARPAARVDLHDLVELARAVAATEDVRRAAQADCRRVVTHAGERAAHRVPPSRDEANVVDRRVGGVQPAEQQRAGPARRRGRVLERLAERAERPFDDADSARPGSSQMPDVPNRRRVAVT
jgi:hypothetical protein